MIKEVVKTERVIEYIDRPIPMQSGPSESDLREKRRKIKLSSRSQPPKGYKKPPPPKPEPLK